MFFYFYVVICIAVQIPVIAEMRKMNDKVTDMVLMEDVRQIWHTGDNYFDFKGFSYY